MWLFKYLFAQEDIGIQVLRRFIQAACFDIIQSLRVLQLPGKRYSILTLRNSKLKLNYIRLRKDYL